jgi:hypothetical protein
VIENTAQGATNISHVMQAPQSITPKKGKQLSQNGKIFLKEGRMETFNERDTF